MKTIGRKIVGLLQVFLEVIYPPLSVCPICDQEFMEEYPRLLICKACLRRLPLIFPPTCRFCGRPLKNTETIGTCLECRKDAKYHTYGSAVAVYDGFMKEILRSAKFDYRPDLATAVGGLLALKVESDPKYDRIEAVIPVPLHPRKIALRGYNQALLMARPVAESLRRPLLTDTLVRTRPTESQSRLGRRARRENVSGAFALTDCSAVAGKRLLLIDDICTTGSTLSECARVLLLSGAREVEVLTAAVGVLAEELQIR